MRSSLARFAGCLIMIKWTTTRRIKGLFEVAPACREGKDILLTKDTADIQSKVSSTVDVDQK
jgi:hypothetical protein